MRTSLPSALLFAVVVAFGFQAAVPHLPPVWGYTLSDFLIMLTAAYASVGYWRGARRNTGRARAAMIVGACSSALWSLGNALFLLTRSSLLGTAGTDIGGLLSLLATMLLPVGLILIAAPTRGLARVRRLIDIAAVAGAILILAWQFILAPAVATTDLSVIIADVHFLVPEALAVALALVTASTSAPTRNAHALHLLACAAAVLAVTMMIVVHNGVRGSLWYEHGVGAGFVLGAILMALSSRHELPASGEADVRRMVISVWAVLPYIPVILAVAAVAVVQVVTGQLGAVLVWLLLGTFCLVLLRQLTSLVMVGSMAVTLQEQKAHLAYQAHHDPLTGLPNRAAFRERGAAAIGDAGRVALLLLDLDGFKPINDSLGHSGGDEALVTVGHRLAAALRPEDVVCRLGGDEFAVLVTDISDDDTTSLAQRLLTTISAPMTIHGSTVAVGVSIGITPSQPGTPDSLDRLLREADLAMYDAKARGKGAISFFRDGAAGHPGSRRNGPSSSSARRSFA
ncbi:GGDEF domain-containing protein [Actinoplanes missouriensis]|uniref:GGDEF domain-containing protein n=1 Tax=Actinoplanes missouriensis TaxID=1866 RepID=UPI00341162CC